MLPRGRRSKELEANIVCREPRDSGLMPSIEPADVPTPVDAPSANLLREVRDDEARGLGSGIRPIVTDSQLEQAEQEEASQSRRLRLVTGETTETTDSESSIANVELLSDPEIRVLAAAFPPNLSPTRTVPLIRRPKPTVLMRLSKPAAHAAPAAPTAHEGSPSLWVLVFAINAIAFKILAVLYLFAR